MRHHRLLAALAVVAIAAGCAHNGTSALPNSPRSELTTPQSVSPALIPPAPMAKTEILPASAMQSPVKPASAVQDLSYSQIPGSASQIASAIADGTLWALSTLPSGADRYIWHYDGTTWTNISGLASQIAVAPDGSLYAINSGGGTFKYTNGNWTALGGGASAITVAADGSIYVLTNGGAAADKAIWHNVNGTWSQAPGSGVALAGNWDTSGPYAGSSGTISAGGFYILNSIGAIWYENSNGTFAQLPANASAIAPSYSGGVFVLGYPANGSGNNIYYYDLNNPGWSAQPGSGVGIATGFLTLYVLGSSGAIYSTPILPKTRLYVTNFLINDYTAFPADSKGDQSPAYTCIFAGLNKPWGITTDSFGSIWVADYGANDLRVFTPGPACSFGGQIAGGSTGLSGPAGIAIASNGDVYVSNYDANRITVYPSGAFGNTTPIQTISGSNTGLSFPDGIAIDSSGYVYVANSSANSIPEFTSASNGNVAPSVIIRGAATGLNGPEGVALGSGTTPNIYVANRLGKNVTVYSWFASGNTAPIATIGGSNTGLNFPKAIALDASGKIYVADSDDTIKVFAANATGNVAPLAVIGGSDTALSAPQGLVVR